MKVNVFEFIKDSAAKVRATATKEVLAIYERAETVALELAEKAAEKGEEISERFRAALVELDAAAKADRARIVAEAAGLEATEPVNAKKAAPAPIPAVNAIPTEAKAPGKGKGK